MEPHFGGRGGPFEKAMVVSYRLSIVTVVLSVTIRPLFAISNVSEAQINRGVGHFVPKFPVAPLGVDP